MISLQAKPAAKFSPETLPGARILIEKINRTSISLAHLLAGLGARVRLVDAGRQVEAQAAALPLAHDTHSTVEAYLAAAIPADQWEQCQALEQAGVGVQLGWDPQADPFDFDILVADMYPPPTRPFIGRPGGAARWCR